MGRLLEKLADGKILVSDGAWGTFLHEKGMKTGECPELWNLERPQDVQAIAASYVKAGSDIILTNSFGASPFKLAGYGLHAKCYDINRAAGEISRRAAGDSVLVLGSVGPTGKMVMMGEIQEDEMKEGMMEQVRGLADGGVDGIVMETMADLEEARICIEAAKAVCDLDIGCTFTFSQTQSGEYRSMMGAGVEEYMMMATTAGADFIGANCGNGTAGMIEIVKEIRRIDQKIPVLVHSNAGLPEYRDGETVFPESPEEMASQVKDLLTAGVNMVGGCCGSTPEHICMMADQVRS